MIFKRFILALTLAPFIVSATPEVNTPHFQENAPPSLADHTHISKKKDPVDGGWLPDLVGLPTKEQVLNISAYVDNIVKKEPNKRCRAVDPRLRKLVFQHFLVYQHIANAQGVYFDSNRAHRWASVLGMTLKESSGDPTNITDMQSHTITTYRPLSDLERWKEILGSAAEKRVQLTTKTNFGLTQTSADRLFVAFKLANDESYDTEFLEGQEGAETPRKISLNSAIAIRRLIWFFQDFAQGRITNSDMRIHQADINKPEYVSRYQEGLDMALLYCGTPLLYKEGVINNESLGNAALRDAMASIAYCKLGNAQSGYGNTLIDAICFAEWVTLCPALNISIATLTPLNYFATRDASPLCEDTFNSLIIKKGDSQLENFFDF